MSDAPTREDVAKLLEQVTQGDWSLDPSSGLDVVFGNFGIVAIANGDSREWPANAALIALAPFLARAYIASEPPRSAECTCGGAEDDEMFAVHMAHCNMGEYEGTCKYGERATCPALSPADLDRAALARPVVAALVGDVQFLLDRLDEWTADYLTDSSAPDYMGHVQPPVARLRASLTALEGGAA